MADPNNILGKCGKLVGEKINAKLGSLGVEFGTDGLVTKNELGELDDFQEEFWEYTADDSDNDGVVDPLDPFPNDPTESTDTDKDGVGDNTDPFPNDPTEWIDKDNDGIGDNEDTLIDSDNDGTGDDSDDFPNDPTETKDTDRDGVGDNTDVFINDPFETKDSDFDGVGDNADRYPFDPNLISDPMGCFVNFPTQGLFGRFGSEWVNFRHENQDITDHIYNTYSVFTALYVTPEKFGVDRSRYVIGWKTGDNRYDVPDTIEVNDRVQFSNSGVDATTAVRGLAGIYYVQEIVEPWVWVRQNPSGTTTTFYFDGLLELGCNPVGTDSDGDGVLDIADAFPSDPNEWQDSDGDGIGDNSDPDLLDSDGDGVVDSQDDFPEDPEQVKDTDGDGYGDTRDDFPNDPNEWVDTDGDGVGDNADFDPDDPSVISDPNGCFANWGDVIGSMSEIFVGSAYKEAHDKFHGVGWSNDWRDVQFQHDTIDMSENIYDGLRFFKFGESRDHTIDGRDGYGRPVDSGNIDPYDEGLQGWVFTMHKRGDDQNTFSLPDGLQVGDRIYLTNGGIYRSVWNGYDWGNTEGYYYVKRIVRDIQIGYRVIHKLAWLACNNEGVDAFPLDDTQTYDRDGDGYGDNPDGNNPDLYPDDPTEWADSDGDGVPDNTDGAPFDPTETLDTDGDGVGDKKDLYPTEADDSTDFAHRKNNTQLIGQWDISNDPQLGMTHDFDHARLILKDHYGNYLGTGGINTGGETTGFWRDVRFHGTLYFYFKRSLGNTEYATEQFWHLLGKRYCKHTNRWGMVLVPTHPYGVRKTHLLVYNPESAQYELRLPTGQYVVVDDNKLSNGGGNIHKPSSVYYDSPRGKASWDEINQDMHFVHFHYGTSRNDTFAGQSLPLSADWEGYNTINEYATFATDEIEPSNTIIKICGFTEVPDLRSQSDPNDLPLQLVNENKFDWLNPSNSSHSSAINKWLIINSDNLEFVGEESDAYKNEFSATMPKVGEKVKLIKVESLGIAQVYAYTIYIPAQTGRSEAVILKVAKGFYADPNTITEDSQIFTNDLYEVSIPDTPTMVVMSYKVLLGTTPLQYGVNKTFILSDYWYSDIWIQYYQYVTSLKNWVLNKFGSSYVLTDSDYDGVADASDQFPYVANEVDTDLDGVYDSQDAFPDDPTEWLDTDEDGVGDNADVDPNNPLIGLDSDGDGVADVLDAYPYDATQSDAPSDKLFNTSGVYWNREMLDGFGLTNDFEGTNAGQELSEYALGRPIQVGDIIELEYDLRQQTVYYSSPDVFLKYVGYVTWESAPAGTYYIWKIGTYYSNGYNNYGQPARPMYYLMDVDGNKLNTYVRGRDFISINYKQGWHGFRVWNNYNKWDDVNSVRNWWRLYKLPYVRTELIL